MKRLSQRPGFVCVVLCTAVMLAACATLTVVQPEAAGKYRNEEYRFTVEYPDHYAPQGLKRADEVFHAANPTIYRLPQFTVNIADAEEGATLDAKAWITSVRKTSHGLKRFKVLSEKMVTLNDGTPALAMFYKYTYKESTKLQSASMWILKDGKSISATATTILGGATTPDKLLKMVSSFKFY